MQRVIGIQRKERASNQDSGAFRNCDHYCHCEGFVVDKSPLEALQGIEVFFPSPSDSKVGVGLTFDSPEVAAAVAHALLSVADGGVSRTQVTFKASEGKKPQP